MKRIIGRAIGAAVLIALAIWIGRVVFEDPHVARGRTIFAQYCVSCHGVKGRGDGFNATHLDPRPRDLSDRVESYMAEGTNEEIFKAIREGMAGVFPPEHGAAPKSLSLLGMPDPYAMVCRPRSVQCWLGSRF